MNILYLYAELMGYQIPVLEEYVANYNANVHVVHWNHIKLTPYSPPSIKNVWYYKRTDFQSKQQLVKLALSVNPDIIYVSGWMDKGYLYIAKKFKRTGIPVVSGSDTQWKGNLKQRLATLIFPLTIKRCFTHLWVAGPYQFEYARKLGFNKKEIIFNCLTTDIEIFNKAYFQSKYLKNKNYPHRFLFVGRFDNIKGISLLIEAWKEIRNERNDWELCFIGNGPLKSFLEQQEDVLVKDFMQPNDLINEVLQAGCFILPSIKEPWALVLHEFAAAGLPIICSDACGAAPLFVVPGYNGFIFDSFNTERLIEKMRQIIHLSDETLTKYSINSHLIGVC